jgi:peptidoglycan L-alanyl-D-glutamate endopeptidase CwlK
VQEGVRSLEHEQQCINQGVSKLHNPADCQHCIQADGFGHAMDLVPYIDGQPKWVWEAIYPVAAALQQVALAQGVRLRWGGVWDRVLNDLSLGPVALKAAVGEYCARHAGPDFLDGPHYELVI